MALDDSIDWQCWDNLLSTLRLCTKGNGYNTDVKTVQLIKSIVQFKGYPLVLVCPGQINPLQEYLSREDVLPVTLIFTDGVVQEESEISYIERYKNVHADIIKCLKSNKTLIPIADGSTKPEGDPVCEDIVIPSYGYATIKYETVEEDVAYFYLEIERSVDTDNPYNKA